MMLQEAVALFLLAKADLSALTLRWYERQLRFLIDWILSNPGQDWLDYRSLTKFFAEDQARVKAGEIRPSTVDAKYRSLKAMYNYLVEMEELSKSPLDKVKRPKTVTGEPSHIVFADFKRLSVSIQRDTWLDLRDRLIVEMLFWCGMRVSEVVALNKRDVNQDDEIVYVQSGKGGDGRYAVLLPSVSVAFTEYIEVCPTYVTDSVFLSAHGDSFTASGVTQMLRRRCAAAGIVYRSPHAFRHGIAMYLLNECGADMTLIQGVLGHKDLHTTYKFYARWRTKNLVEQYKKKTAPSIR